MRKSVIAVVVVLLVVAPVGAVQTVARPEEVGRQMPAPTRAGEWTGYADLLHPAALVAFQRMFRELVAGDAALERTSELGGRHTGRHLPASAHRTEVLVEPGDRLARQLGLREGM